MANEHGLRHDLGVEANYLAYMTGNPVEADPGSKGVASLKGGPFRPAKFADRGQPPGPPPGGGPRNGPPAGGGPGLGGGPPGMRGPAMGGAAAGMAIHKSEGLVPINDRCESNVLGLFAAGDALGSYMCGAIYTQIGSSLAGSAVQGGIAGEAAGIAAAAREIDVPVVIAFTLETDGRLSSGQPLGEAITEVDDATESAPFYYMIKQWHQTRQKSATHFQKS